MNIPRWIVLMLALQTLILLGQWVGQPALSTAQAQIPDTGAQRQEIIDQLKITNSKLDDLITLLQSGNIRVKTDAPSTQPAR
ncbi:MAG TPA: hypothetical protein VG722_02855 [Tepidisphaeraceae bacterium]|nr:hypothetical protein [Tepidisphaeraceae bacterium]